VKRPIAAAVLFAIPAWAGEPVFAETKLSRIKVVSTQHDGAMVEGPKGELTFVDVGDTLGEEKALVKRVSGSCVSLLMKSGPVTLCADGPQVPVPNS
jgi:hypothetical protein